MSFGYQPSPFRPRKVSVTPFNVKRKQVNPDVLVPSSNNNRINQKSSLALFPKEKSTPDSTALQAHIDDLQAQLKKVTQDQQSWRHKCLLLTNEREEFELACKEKAAREKDIMLLEVKLLKEVHLEKIQSLSCAMAQWQNRVASLRAQLKQHSIEEGKLERN
ncbi:hypothetical protein PHYBLDRAFT_163657 [Phycomyces blakesleeanus NRRL 1555(-)]|uniref:Uncharacterized protein n=1 Tax=Phycomyces blakesleeanus (strain ATCC 8743b / DSM 1359 / FGSC 10004 / NBRC 33097 / NRRL 1555) TaxID=763407 RepID=A0A167PUG1_PHYB8|nr:hypothetical protein PHYBLDRAFT_163657 [Phycomyces blakesleeanus NRRL 1555(-)]OAD78557.1 hypothetical protein PHYBLDRAFT_163657 [Phycomyces blakesleeanus NRRL 1555(-)]|eukprot:XP_018296597.1 hypothetical protein PHYBLDRAFT_163657 [Phycomyces blakesleeanus NRRL 1555(-)]